MSKQESELARPAGPPPDARKKERNNVVVARSGDAIFEIPLDVAKKHAVSGDRAKELACLVPSVPDSQGGDEVGGRHMAYLPALGRYGYHSNWLFGPYIWWRDGVVYTGWHWHPRVDNPLAYDT